MSRPAPAFLVVAKAPEPRLVKTRLCPPLTPHDAAVLAAAALLDTLRAAQTAAEGIGGTTVLALSGDLGRAVAGPAIRSCLCGWTVVPQRGAGLGSRLAAAHADAAALVPGAATVQVGMDTPQVTAEMLTQAAEALDGADAVLGPALDGGWWLLGLRRPHDAMLLSDVAMSRPDTGAQTRAVLRRSGRSVVDLPLLADVDVWADVADVARAAPGSAFARVVATVGPPLEVD